MGLLSVYHWFPIKEHLDPVLAMLPTTDGIVDDAVYQTCMRRFNQVAVRDWGNTHFNYPVPTMFTFAVFQCMLYSGIGSHTTKDVRGEIMRRYDNNDGCDGNTEIVDWRYLATAWVVSLPEADADQVPDHEGCAICWRNYDEQREGEPTKPWIKVIPCGHAYDVGCLIEALTTAEQFPWKCPYDRQNLLQVALDRDAPEIE